MALVWARDGRDWPGREASRFVIAGGMRWHVQIRGTGPVALLVHGSAASTHSWRGLAPELAGACTVVAPDLPGHAFSAPAPRHTRGLGGTARALAALLAALDLAPALAVGHSAGAAVLARMAIDGLCRPQLLASLNGAFLAFPGLAGVLFPAAARLLSASPLAPALLALGAGERRVTEGLLRTTGSRLDRHGLDLYARLARDPGHVRGSLALLAEWDLETLERDLPRLPCPLLLFTGERDAMVPPREAERVQARVPGAERRMLPGVGHLAHEERPAWLAQELLAAALAHGVPRGAGPA